MQDIIKILKERKTTKKYLKDKIINEEIIEKLKEILTLSPSSINLQPWKFVLVKTKQAKQLLKDAFINYSINLENFLDSSLAVIFLKRNKLDKEYIEKLIEKEDKDQRYLNQDFKKNSLNYRLNLLSMNEKHQKTWLEKQVFLNAGHFVLSTHLLGLSSTIMEGFDKKIIDEKLNIKDYSSCLVVCLGYSDIENDYNQKLNKSRLDINDLIKEI